MTANIVKRNEFELFQPIAMTYARYHYSAIAKNVIYCIYDLLQKWQTHEKTPQRDLFEDIEITLNVSTIAKNHHNADVWKAIETELAKRPLRYEYVNEDGQTVDACLVLIPYMERIRGSANITVKLIKEAIPVLLYLCQGFTAYNKTIAMSLPSIYSKRLYELCCHWKDTGIYVTTIDEFRVLMNCKDKFQQIGQLRDKVIDRAVKDINELSELHIFYILIPDVDAKGRGRKGYKGIKFFIELKKSEKQHYYKDYKIVYDYLYSVYRSDCALKVADWLMDNKRIVAASTALSRVQNDVTKGKIKKHGLWNYVITILRDLKIPADVLPVWK